MSKIFYVSDYHFYHELAACVEVNNYEPCTLEELKENNSIFKR